MIGIHGYSDVTFDGICYHERGFCDCNFRKIHQKRRPTDDEQIEEVEYLRDYDINDNPVYAGSLMVSDDESLFGGEWNLDITKIKTNLVELKGRRVDTPASIGDEIWLRTTDSSTGEISDGTPYFIDDSSDLYQFTLNPEVWEEEDGHYLYSLSIPTIKENSILDLALKSNSNSELAKLELEAASDASISVYQETDELTTVYLRANGTKPDIDLPIVVVVRNGGTVLKN